MGSGWLGQRIVFEQSVAAFTSLVRGGEPFRVVVGKEPCVLYVARNRAYHQMVYAMRRDGDLMVIKLSLALLPQNSR
jgi:hypothetical protein